MIKFTSKQNKEFWNDFATKSKDNRFGASGGRHLVDIEDDFILSALKKIKPNSLLDIGCGNGQRTLIFSKYAKKNALGIDYSEKMIEEAWLMLKKQSKSVRNKLSFENIDIHRLPSKEKFDVIISCRCFINQTTPANQIKLFEILHNRLNSKGSLLIAEISQEGMKRLNSLRIQYKLKPMKPRWHNLHINEKLVFSKIKRLFHIKKIRRAGTFYFLSRVFHPAIVFPKDPEQESIINEIALRSENITKKPN